LRGPYSMAAYPGMLDGNRNPAVLGEKKARDGACIRGSV